MFAPLENRVAALLREELPATLIPPERIVAGPVPEAPSLPLLSWSAGDFTLPGKGEILAVPRAEKQLSLSVISLLAALSETREEADELLLAAMAVILVRTADIEKAVETPIVQGNYSLSFGFSELSPLEGVRRIDSGGPFRAETLYKIKGTMTATRLDFDHEKITEIETRLTIPPES